MELVVFNPKENLTMLNGWLAGHNMQPMTECQLPETGFIFNYEKTPAVLFLLYKAEGKTCWLEDAISNPDLPKEIINKLIDTMFPSALEAMEEYATFVGLLEINILTKLPMHAKRLREIGFEQEQRVILMKKRL